MAMAMAMAMGRHDDQAFPALFRDCCCIILLPCSAQWPYLDWGFSLGILA